MSEKRNRQEQGCLSTGLTLVGIFGLMAGFGGLFTDFWLASAVIGCASILILWHQYSTYGRASSKGDEVPR
jgi:hypothetical protein